MPAGSQSSGSIISALQIVLRRIPLISTWCDLDGDGRKVRTEAVFSSRKMVQRKNLRLLSVTKHASMYQGALDEQLSES